MKCIISAYYYSSETSYAFGPFTQREVLDFVKWDKYADEHSEWYVTWVNNPKLYHSGLERAC